MSAIYHPLNAYFDTMYANRSTVVWRGYKVMLFKQAWGELAIAEQGAQILHYRPSGHAPALWLSDQSAGPGEAIRGGIPLCWPWFGAHPTGAKQPNHGLARTAIWDLCEEQHLDNFSHWVLEAPHLLEGVTLRLIVRASQQKLDIQLSTQNDRDQAFTMTQALHSYFQLSDTANLCVTGLEEEVFYDKLEQRFRREPESRWNLAMDRIYQHSGNCQLIDQGLARTISISKGNSKSTVIWNPGKESVLRDIAPNQLSSFICIEAANTAQYDAINVPAGRTFSISTVIKCRNMGL